MTAYLQVIIDNFSRYIIGWKISENINAAMTVDTIKQALITKNAPHAFMMDAGTENVNRSVLKILVHENVKRIIAKQTIHWSNSMVEAFFRSLKNNYLYARTSQTFTELNRRLSYYFKQHNEVIPHSSLGGAVPIEVYKSIWNETKRDNLMQSIQTGLLNRIKFNKELVCCLHGR
jgi:putative transposase